MATDSTETRLEALDKAVRISLAKGGLEPDEDIVTRADKFHSFLTKESS